MARMGDAAARGLDWLGERLVYGKPLGRVLAWLLSCPGKPDPFPVPVKQLPHPDTHRWTGPADGDRRVRCANGCGCWVRPTTVLQIECGGPSGIDPKGDCPLAGGEA